MLTEKRIHEIGAVRCPHLTADEVSGDGTRHHR